MQDLRAPITIAYRAAYWDALKEAYEAEKEYQRIAAKDRRRLTNEVVFKSDEAHAKLVKHILRYVRG